jgi:predicted GIY-YIG superfamily endonuclease
MNVFHLYILRCADGSYYTGHTDDLENRLAQHQLGEIPGCYTSTRLPVELAFATDFATREEALERELQVKRWSRAKKEALIRGDWVGLQALSRNRQQTTKSPGDGEHGSGVAVRGSTGSPRTE